MQKNDDAYLLYLMKRDCKSNNKSQSEKALTVSLFFVFLLPVIQGPSCPLP